MKKKRYIDEQWAFFQNSFDGGMSAFGSTIHRQIFFCGVLAALSIQAKSPETEGGVNEIMDALQVEIEEFKQALAAGSSKFEREWGDKPEVSEEEMEQELLQVMQGMTDYLYEGLKKRGIHSLENALLVTNLVAQGILLFIRKREETIGEAVAFRIARVFTECISMLGELSPASIRVHHLTGDNSGNAPN